MRQLRFIKYRASKNFHVQCRIWKLIAPFRKLIQCPQRFRMQRGRVEAGAGSFIAFPRLSGSKDGDLFEFSKFAVQKAINRYIRKLICEDLADIFCHSIVGDNVDHQAAHDQRLKCFDQESLFVPSPQPAAKCDCEIWRVKEYCMK